VGGFVSVTDQKWTLADFAGVQQQSVDSRALGSRGRGAVAGFLESRSQAPGN